MKDETILQLFTQHEKNIKESIELNGRAIRATMMSEVDVIHIMDASRNNRIGKNEEKIKVVLSETSVSRWVHRNPYISIAIFLVLFAGFFYGIHRINIPRTIENVTGVSIIDHRTDTVERPAR